MERCPTCKAKYAGKPVCHRCGTDLAALKNILHRAALHYLEARLAFLEKRYPDMLHHARRAVSLRYTTEGLKLLSCALVLNRTYEEAFGIWNYQNAYKLIKA